MASTKAYTID